MMERREALKWMVRGIGATLAGIVAIPGIASLLSPVFRERRGPTWLAVGQVDRFTPGEMHKAVLEIEDAAPAARGVFVWAKRDGSFTVYSRACTDLACPVAWDQGSQWFYCPCHGGIFNREGEPEAGPPAYPLYRYATRVRQGILEVDLSSVPPLT